MNKIILTADTELCDNLAREWNSKQDTRIDTINERTKNLVIKVKDLEKRIKELEKYKAKYEESKSFVG